MASLAGGTAGGTVGARGQLLANDYDTLEQNASGGPRWPRFLRWIGRIGLKNIRQAYQSDLRLSLPVCLKGIGLIGLLVRIIVISIILSPLYTGSV